jgi:type VI secretion system secreted protein VgrG
MSDMQIEHTEDGECINLHSDKDISIMANNNEDITIVKNRTINVLEGTHTETIEGDTKIIIHTGKYEHEVSTGIASYKVQGALTEKYNTTQDTTVAGNITIKSDKGEILIDAANKITLHTGDSKITMDKAGTISITGKKIFIIGNETVKASGDKFEASGGTEAKLGTGNQNITTSTSKTALSGAAINASAVGMHEITGAVVKIN